MVDILLRGYEDNSDLIRHSYNLEKSGLSGSFEPASARGEVVATIRSSNVTRNWICTGSDAKLAINIAELCCCCWCKPAIHKWLNVLLVILVRSLLAIYCKP